MPPRRREGERRADPSRAQQLRETSSTPERVLWLRIRDRWLRGLKFRRQHPLGPYVADFYCHDAEVVIELDGRTRAGRVEADAARDAWMHARGLPRRIRVEADAARDAWMHARGLPRRGSPIRPGR